MPLDLSTIMQIKNKDLQEILDNPLNPILKNPLAVSIAKNKLGDKFLPIVKVSSVASQTTQSSKTKPTKKQLMQTTATASSSGASSSTVSIVVSNYPNVSESEVNTALAMPKREQKHYALSQLGLKNKDIGILTGAPTASIARDIWKLKNAK